MLRRSADHGAAGTARLERLGAEGAVGRQLVAEALGDGRERVDPEPRLGRRVVHESAHLRHLLRQSELLRLEIALLDDGVFEQQVQHALLGVLLRLLLHLPQLPLQAHLLLRDPRVILLARPKLDQLLPEDLLGILVALGQLGVALSCEMLILLARRKDTRRVTEFCQGSHGVALKLYPHAGRIPEGYQKDTGRAEQMSAR